MMLYHLEINQRIDYIYKLSTHLENSPLANLDNLTYTDNSNKENKENKENRRYKKYKNFIFTTRYVPDVIRPVNINNSIVFNKYKKYYTPMLYLDEHYQRNYLSRCSYYRIFASYDHTQRHDSNIEECSFPLDYYLDLEVRAKALELFKYHFSFKSNNYKDMSSFINKHYNPILYHDTNKLWKYVAEFDTTITNDAIIKLAEEFPVANIDRTSAASIRKFIKRFIKTNTEVNNSIFYPKEIE